MQFILIKIFFVLLLFSNLVPRLNIAGVRVGVEDVLTLLSLLLFINLFIDNIRHNKSVALITLPLCIFVGIFMMYGMLQSLSYLGEVKVPSELWQYIKRIICFLIATIALLNATEQQKSNFVSLVLIAIFIYLFIGILQIVGFEALSEVYGRTDKQISTALYNNHQQRIYSIAGFSTAWGGVSVFMFFVTFGLVSLKKMYAQPSRVLLFASYLIYVMAIINIIASGSRGAWISTFFGLVLFYFLMIPSLKWKSFAIALFSLFLLYVVFFTLNTYFPEKLEFMLYRFNLLGDTGGGGRDSQIDVGLGLLTTWYEWLAGISNANQRVFGQSFGIESEPFNIFVNYGLIGSVLIYLTIVNLICVYNSLFNKPSLLGYNRLLYASIVSAILSYILFSFGYFYFAELIVGTFSWVVFGVLVGAGLTINRKEP